jgi:hypothetical protein
MPFTQLVNPTTDSAENAQAERARRKTSCCETDKNSMTGCFGSGQSRWMICDR